MDNEVREEVRVVLFEDRGKGLEIGWPLGSVAFAVIGELAVDFGLHRLDLHDVVLAEERVKEVSGALHALVLETVADRRLVDAGLDAHKTVGHVSEKVRLGFEVHRAHVGQQVIR